jgi:hypothetical protein
MNTLGEEICRPTEKPKMPGENAQRIFQQIP